MNLKTGAGIAVYLRNIARAIAGITAENGIKIDIYSTPDGFVTVRFGDYEYIETPDGDGRYYFRPLHVIEEWKRVKTNEIHITGEKNDGLCK